MAIQVPFIKDQRLREIAEQFLADFHPSRRLPVPIEEIVEFDFGIDIIALPGLDMNYEIVAFISTDLKEIRVDKGVYDAGNKNRYRFSLAHELSHAVLHRDIFQQLSFATIAEWKKSRDAISESQYSRLEFQANFLAGLILVPPSELREKFEEAVERAASVGIDINNARPEAWDNIERWLASVFGVSTAVISRRAIKDGLWEGEEM